MVAFCEYSEELQPAIRELALKGQLHHVEDPAVRVMINKQTTWLDQVERTLVVPSAGPPGRHDPRRPFTRASTRVVRRVDVDAHLSAVVPGP